MTHEKYAEILGDEFGRGVRAFFTDEPSLISWNIRTAVYPILPWHRDFPAKFEAKYGMKMTMKTKHCSYRDRFFKEPTVSWAALKEE